MTAASDQIDQQIAGLSDWRGGLLARLRKLILEADPHMTEEWKWNTSVWTHNGPVCSAAAFKDHLKYNFFKGASLDDPQKLFNAGLEAKTSRAIDFSQGDAIAEPALKVLIRSAVASNNAGKKR